MTIIRLEKMKDKVMRKEPEKVMAITCTYSCGLASYGQVIKANPCKNEIPMRGQAPYISVTQVF